MNSATEEYADSSDSSDPDKPEANQFQSSNSKLAKDGSTEVGTGALKSEAKAIVRYFDRVEALLDLGQELIVGPEEAARFCARVEEHLGYPVSAGEILETLQGLELGKPTVSRTVAALEINRIAQALGISFDSAANLSKLLESHLSITAANRVLLQALDQLSGRRKYLSQLVWLLELGHSLGTDPRQTKLFCGQVASILGDEVDDDEMLRAVRDLRGQTQNVEAFAWQIRINRLEQSVGPLERGQSQQLLQAVDSRLPSRATSAEISAVLDSGGDSDTTVDELSNQITIGRIAERLQSSNAGARDFVDAVNASTNYQHRPRHVLDALSQLEELPGPESGYPESAKAANLLQIARLLEVDAIGARQFYEDVRGIVESPITLAEVAGALEEISEGERSADSVAAFIAVNKVLARAMPAQRATNIKLWLQKELLRPVPYPELRERMAGVLAQESLFSGGQMSEASFINALKFACLMETDMGTAIKIKREAARKSGRHLSYDVLLPIMRGASQENRQLPRAVDYVVLARIFNISSRDYSELNFIVNNLTWEPERLDVFWKLASNSNIKRRLRIQDLRYMQELALLPAGGLQWLEPKGELSNWITKAYVDKRRALMLWRLNRLVTTNNGKAFGRQVEVLHDYRAGLWEELTADRRRYQVPSEGRAEIEVSDQLYELLGLETLRFVVEGVLAPAVHIQFNFGHTIGVIWLEADGQMRGFHHMTDDELFRVLIEVIGLAYYRDLILPYETMTVLPKTTMADHTKAFQSIADPHWRGQKSRPKRAKVKLDEWYEAQERARRYVKGHAPRLRNGFLAGTAQLAESWALGFIRKQGNRWVFDRQRGQPLRIGRLELSGLDLAKPTLFRPPARASAEIQVLLKDIA